MQFFKPEYFIHLWLVPAVLGLFLISRLLENETPVHEDDHRRAAAGERGRLICRDPDASKASPPGA